VRLSIVIASYNEGEKLRKTVESCYDSGLAPGAEVVVADDASEDGSLDGLEGRYPNLRVSRSPARVGVSPNKDRGARAALGETLVFLDGHSKPEPGSIERLYEGVEDWGGQAVVTPSVPALHVEDWRNDPLAVGRGGVVELDTLSFRWADQGALSIVVPEAEEPRYHSPSLSGCALAVSRAAYERIGGFDPDMVGWGVEDVDFGLRAWLMGHPIVHDPGAVVGHRFRGTFEYEVRLGDIAVNAFRMAWKVFDGPTWEAWLANYRGVMPPDDFDDAWGRFEASRASADRDRDYLRSCQDRDMEWYIERFRPPFSFQVPGSTGERAGDQRPAEGP